VAAGRKGVAAKRERREKFLDEQAMLEGKLVEAREGAAYEKELGGFREQKAGRDAMLDVIKLTIDLQNKNLTREDRRRTEKRLEEAQDIAQDHLDIAKGREERLSKPKEKSPSEKPPDIPKEVEAYRKLKLEDPVLAKRAMETSSPEIQKIFAEAEADKAAEAETQAAEAKTQAAEAEAKANQPSFFQRSMEKFRGILSGGGQPGTNGAAVTPAQAYSPPILPYMRTPATAGARGPVPFPAGAPVPALTPAPTPGPLPPPMPAPGVAPAPGVSALPPVTNPSAEFARLKEFFQANGISVTDDQILQAITEDMPRSR
jgi:hypothetical protein